MPAGQGRDQVADAVGVQAAREEHARETLPDGAAEEGLVLVVDLEVRAHGADAALGGQLGLGLVVGHGLGGGGAAEVEGRGGNDGLDGGILGEEGGWLRDCIVVVSLLVSSLFTIHLVVDMSSALSGLFVVFIGDNRGQMDDVRGMLTVTYHGEEP